MTAMYMPHDIPVIGDDSASPPAPPPTHERRPGRGGAARAVGTAGEQSVDCIKNAPRSRSNPAATPLTYMPHVEPALPGTTTGGAE